MNNNTFEVDYCQHHGKLRGPKKVWYAVEGKPSADIVKTNIQAGCDKIVVVHPTQCYVCYDDLNRKQREQDFEDGKSH